MNDKREGRGRHIICLSQALDQALPQGTTGMLSDDMADGMSWPLSGTCDVLQRIANALGTNRDAFFAGGADPAGSRQLRAAQEGAALLQAFNRISDPQMRERCLAYVLAAAAERADLA